MCTPSATLWPMHSGGRVCWQWDWDWISRTMRWLTSPSWSTTKSACCSERDDNGDYIADDIMDTLMSRRAIDLVLWSRRYIDSSGEINFNVSWRDDADSIIADGENGKEAVQASRIRSSAIYEPMHDACEKLLKVWTNIIEIVVRPKVASILFLQLFVETRNRWMHQSYLGY
jgi:hypothetical protein